MHVAMGVLAAAGLALGGCVSLDNNVSINDAGPAPDPVKYRLVVRDYLRTTLIDPYSVRDAQIGKPSPGQIHIEGTLRHEAGWVVCVRANAKNRMGGYTGQRETIVVLRGNTAIASSSPQLGHFDLRTNCASPQYEPFPEIEAAR